MNGDMAFFPSKHQIVLAKDTKEDPCGVNGIVLTETMSLKPDFLPQRKIVALQLQCFAPSQTIFTQIRLHQMTCFQSK